MRQLWYQLLCRTSRTCAPCASKIDASSGASALPLLAISINAVIPNCGTLLVKMWSANHEGHTLLAWFALADLTRRSFTMSCTTPNSGYYRNIAVDQHVLVPSAPVNWQSAKGDRAPVSGRSERTTRKAGLQYRRVMRSVDPGSIIKSTGCCTHISLLFDKK
jgi:hypothetical protein